MKTRQLLLTLFLVVQTLAIGMFGSTISDDVTYDALGLTDDNGWAEDFSGVITSVAEYAGHLEVESGDLVFRYGEGALATTSSAGYVSSIVINWSASAVEETDVVYIYASNDPFTGDEYDGDGDYITEIYKGVASSDTYNFTSDYTYFLIVSSDVARVSSVRTTWTTRDSYAITAVAAHGTIKNTDGTDVSFANVGDHVTLTMKRSGAYCMTGYSVYETANASNVVKDVNYASPETANQTITFDMPGFAVTVEGKYITQPTADNAVSVTDALGNNLTDLISMTSGDVLVYNYTASSDYTGVISVTSSNESVARVVSSPTNAYSGTMTIYAYAKGTVKITINFSADTKYRKTSKNSNAKTAVSRRSVALVTEHAGRCYVVTNSLSGTKLEALEVIADGGNYYYIPTGPGTSAITWYVETIYNSKGNRYQIFNSVSGTTNLDADGMDFYLDDDARTWEKDGSYLYGTDDNRGIVYKTSSEMFESLPYDNHDGNPSLYATSAIEVPITNFSTAKKFSTSDGSADAKDIRSLTTGKYGTICVPFNAPLSFAEGAEFYTITGKYVSGDNLTGIEFEEVTTNLEAGHSYIYYTTGTSIDIYGGAVVTNAVVDGSDGFVGCLPGDGTVSGVGGVTPRYNGYYGMKDNMLHYVASGTPTAKTYRALIKASEISTGSPAPGRRVLYVENIGTSVEDIFEEATAINWNEPVYNVMGMQVGKGTTGVLIQNGQKFLVQ